MQKVQIRFGHPVNVATVPNEEDLQLISNSQDIEALVDYFCGDNKRLAKRFEGFRCYFVDIEDGEYNAVYGSYSEFASSTERVVPIKRIYCKRIN